MRTLNVERRSDAYVVASAEHVVITGFLGPTTIEHTDAVEEVLQSTARRSENGIGTMFFIGEGSPIPPSPVRRHATEIIRGMQSYVKVFGFVIAGSGFIANAKRGVISVIVSGALGSMRFKVFGEGKEACAWLATECASLGVRCPEASSLAEDLAELVAKR